jgi:hypothetical protein
MGINMPEPTLMDATVALIAKRGDSPGDYIDILNKYEKSGWGSIKDAVKRAPAFTQLAGPTPGPMTELGMTEDVAPSGSNIQDIIDTKMAAGTSSTQIKEEMRKQGYPETEIMKYKYPSRIQLKGGVKRVE